MVKTFQAYLPNECHRKYSCVHCRAHLANHDELISKVRIQKPQCTVHVSLPLRTASFVWYQLSKYSRSIGGIYCMDTCICTVQWWDICFPTINLHIHVRESAWREREIFVVSRLHTVSWQMPQNCFSHEISFFS